MNGQWAALPTGHVEGSSSSKREKGEEKMKRLRWIWQGDVYLKAVVLLAVMTSVVSFAYFYSQDMITAFGDAQSRLMIAKQVVSGLHPGLVHLGGIWPPLPQAAMLPLIWNDFLYQSGIAGAVVSMVSYVVATVFLYKLVVSVTENRVAGLIGVIAFSSPSILYMQSVPMSEMPFIAFFVMCVYFLMLWVQDVEKLRFLFLTALAVFLATLTRYEGWVLFWVVTVVIVFAFWKNRFSYAKAEGHFVFFATLALFGVILWFAWNQAIFGDLLYFLRSEYSVRAINEAEIARILPSQRTGGNLLLAFQVYGRTVLDNAGWITTGVSILGLISLFFTRIESTQKLVVSILLFPFMFSVLTLYEGVVTVILHPAFTEGQYWNLRYGVLMLPAVGFFTGFLTEKGKWLGFSVLLLIVVSAILTWQGGIITVKDALHAKISQGEQIQEAAGERLKNNYDGGLVLMQRRTNEHTVFVSTLSLSNVIYEGDQDIWEESLQDPTKHARWVFMRERDGVPDKVWKALHSTPQLLDNYDLVYQNGGIEIYKRKPTL